MTNNDIPPQAVSIVDAVLRATCTAATVQALQQLLDSNGSRVPVSVKHSPESRRPQAQKTTLRASKATGSRRRKQPPVTVLEDRIAGPLLTSRERFRLATEIVNASLKALTTAIQSPAKKLTKFAQKLSISEPDRSSPSNSLSELQAPLRALSINCVANLLDEKFRSRRSSSATLKGQASGLLATAECGSLAFKILRSAEVQRNSGIQAPPLQLEHGLSVFIGKLIALEFYDMAVKELEIIRRRLDNFDASLAQENRGARTAGNRSSAAPSGSGKDSLPDLLMFRNTNAKGPILNLMITTQFQVLRIIAARSNPRDAEVAINHLELGAPSSPAAMIERQKNENSSQSFNKAAQKLESLSRLLSHICGGPESSEQHQESFLRREICPSAAFQYQVLALEIRLKWWKIVGHQGDAMKEIIRPFDKCLACFRRRSTLSKEEEYTLCQAHAERLLTSLVTLRDEAAILIDNIQQALFRLELKQADLAEEYSKFQISNALMNKSQQSLILSNMSKSQICLFTCKRATLSVSAHIELQREQQMLSEMVDLSVILGEDLGEELEELIEIMMALNAFRKAIITLIRKQHQTLNSADQIDIDVILLCAKTLCSGVRFMAELTRKCDKQNNEKECIRARPSTCQLIWDVANPFIESIAMLAKMSMACKTKNWDPIDAGLQCSTLLARRSNDSCCTKRKAQENVNTTSCLVSISNAYWCRFLHVKQNSADHSELYELLTASIDAVRDQPVSFQIAALFPAKLEKLASLYESSNEYGKAAGAYASTVRFLAVNGSVGAAAEVANRESLQVVLKKNGAFGLLGRSILGYQKAIISGDSEASSSRLALDFEELPPIERGLILEHQLDVISSILVSRGCSTRISQIIKELSETLRLVYSLDEHPIRRLRVSVTLMEIQSCQSSALSPKIYEQLVQEWGGTDQISSPGQDVGLQQYRAHLEASRGAYGVLCSRVVDLKNIEYLLTVWYGLLQACHDSPVLETRVGDIAGWQRQLGALAQYLELEGLELQQISVLQLLVRLYELTSPLQLVSALNALGDLYTKLGYSSHAGLALQRAQKHLSKTAALTPVKIRWHLAYAEYSLSIGNVERRSVLIMNELIRVLM